MSKSEEKALKKAQDEPETNSVFDFLYHDSRRVGSLLAQFDQNGLLKEIKQSEHASKGTGRGFSFSGGASTPLTGGGHLGIEVSPKEGGGESLERIYDPFWANAREFLNVLEDNNLILRDVESAGLGSIVLISGSMGIIDLGMLKSMWSLPTVQRKIHEGATEGNDEPEPANRKERLAQERRNKNKSKPELDDDTQLLIEMMPTFPHSLNAMISGEGMSAWATLSEEFFVGHGSDIILKHGLSIPGQWHMLGILDAQPDLGDLDSTIAAADNFQADYFSQSVIGNFAGVMAPIVRALLGRPASSYGMTPLLIFREVSN